MAAIGVERADQPVNKNIIPNPSFELCHQVIATFPFSAVGDVVLKIQPLPGFDEGYEKSCKTRGVIPNSSVEIDLGESEDTYIRIEPGRHTRQQAILFLSGGKPSRVKINLRPSGLEYLNSAIRPALQKDGYGVSDAQLAVSTEYRRDNEMTPGGEFLDTGVTLSKDEIKLKIGRRCTNEQREVLTKWFNSLQE